jgi:hypothetical protein
MRRILPAVIAILCCCECSPLYVPNALHAPLLGNKGEVGIGVLAGSSGTDVRAAYAVSDHVGLMVNGTYDRYAIADENDSTGHHKHLFGEAGVGFFDRIGRHGRWEVYGGAGTGTVDSRTNFDFLIHFDERSHARYSRIFMQPAIGVVNESFDVGCAARLCRVSIDHLTTTDYQGSPYLSTYFFEPALFTRIGYRNVRISLQYGISEPLGEDVKFWWQPWIFSVGCEINFGRNTSANVDSNAIRIREVHGR